MIAIRIAVAATLATVALLPPLSAQQATLAFGQQVRVVSLANGTIQNGRLVFVVADTVVLERGQRTEYPAVGSHGRLEIPRHIGSHVVAGALVGAGVGLLVGQLTWSMRDMVTCPFYGCGPLTGQAIGHGGRVALGGVLGLAVGALVGAHVYTTVWEPVPEDQLDRLRVGLVSEPGGGLGLGASLKF